MSINYNDSSDLHALKKQATMSDSSVETSLCSKIQFSSVFEIFLSPFPVSPSLPQQC